MNPLLACPLKLDIVEKINHRHFGKKLMKSIGSSP